MAKTPEEIEAAFQARNQQQKQQPEPAEESGKYRGIIGSSLVTDILFYLVLIVLIVCAVLFAGGIIGGQTIGGYRFYEVLTTSMESVYPKGSLLLIQEIDPKNLAVGDDITFEPDAGGPVSHRIEEIHEVDESRGGRAFVTRGVENAQADPEVVTAQQVIGKVVKGIPGLGAAFSWLGRNLWVLLLLFLTVVFFVVFLKLFIQESRREKGKKKKEFRHKKERRGKCNDL